MSAPDNHTPQPSRPPDPPSTAPGMAAEPGGPEQDLDECRTLATLVSAVQALANTPGHPSADQLVQTLQELARACRRRLQAARADVRPGIEGSGRNAWDPPSLARAEALADRAEQVARWAREQVLGGNPGELDQWLARLRPAGSSPAARPDAPAAAAPAAATPPSR